MPPAPSAELVYGQQQQQLQQVPRGNNHVNMHEICKNKTMGSRFKAAAVAALLYVLLTNRAVFRVVNDMYMFVTSIPDQATDEFGTPTLKGAVTMALILFLMMMYLV